jgi:hypothetical protein
VIVLDENIVEDEAILLRDSLAGVRQIGVDIGRKGMQDDEVIPFLHSLKRVTFITRDRRFFTRDSPHSNYCLLVLAVEQYEVALIAKRTLKHPDFDTAQKRMGAIIHAAQSGLRVRRLNQAGEISIAWLKLV